MELQEFIKQSLVQIVKGVNEAQNEAIDVGARINPVGKLLSGGGETHFVQTELNPQSIQFDVAISVSEEKTAGGKISVLANILNLGAEAKMENLSSLVHRIKFEVPVEFTPNHHRPLT